MHTLAVFRPVHFPGSFSNLFPEATTVREVLGHILDVMRLGPDTPIEFSVQNLQNAHLHPLTDAQRGFSENDAIALWPDEQERPTPGIQAGRPPHGEHEHADEQEGGGVILALRPHVDGRHLSAPPRIASAPDSDAQEGAKVVRFPGRARLRLVPADPVADDQA